MRRNHRHRVARSDWTAVQGDVTPPLAPWLANAYRVRPDLRLATEPDAAPPTTLHARTRCPSRPNGQRSSTEPHTRWIKVGGNVSGHEDKILTKELESRYDETEVQPLVQDRGRQAGDGSGSSGGAGRP